MTYSFQGGIIFDFLVLRTSEARRTIFGRISIIIMLLRSMYPPYFEMCIYTFMAMVVKKITPEG